MQLFRADLSDEGSFDEAVEGCTGVFHLAASMEFVMSNVENIGKHNLASWLCGKILLKYMVRANDIVPL